MGRLVPFSPSTRPRPGPTGPREQAEILIFTGVRYARDLEPKRKKSARTRRPRKDEVLP